MRARGSRLPGALMSIGIASLLLISSSVVAMPASSSESDSPQTSQPWETAGTPSTTAYPHCKTANTQIQVASENQHFGNIVVNRGQTYIIANRSFIEIGNVVVNGGNFVVSNATFRGHDPNAGDLWPILQGGGCMEITNSKEFAVTHIQLGGPNPTATPDNSTLLVNHSVLFSEIFPNGRNVTEKAQDSVFEGAAVSFNGYADIYGNQSRVIIESSLVAVLDLGFIGGTGGSISNLHGGYFKYWDLHQNLTLYGVPYDLTLHDVTIAPNLVGSGPRAGLELGWGIDLGPSWAGRWPNLTITNSELTVFQIFNIQSEFGFSTSTPVFLGDLGSPRPLTQTFFGSIRLVNTTTVGTPGVGCHDCTLVLSNISGTGVWLYGRSNVTMIDSYMGDDFYLTNCLCTFRSVNSWLGTTKNFTVKDLPYYQYFPNATNYYATSRGIAVFWNSTVKITENLTYNLVYLDYRTDSVQKLWPTVQNSTITRSYPVLYTDSRGHGISNLQVSLTTPSGRVISQMTTNQNGRLDVPIVFNDANYTSNILLSTKFGNLTCQAPIGLTSSTPFRLGDSVASFTEAGLPPGAPWSVTVNGTTLSSSSANSINFCLPARNYTYNHVTTEALGNSYREYASPAFIATPQSGSLTLNGSVTHVSLSFTYQGSTLSVQSGSGLFSSLTSSNKGIVVAPGQMIQASISITSVNRYGYGPSSLIGTPSWGDPSASFWTVSNFNLANGTSTLSVPVDLTTPAKPGTYYLFFASLSDSPAGTASQTNANSNLPIWNDGNDIAGLNDSQVAQAQAYGFIRSNVLQNQTAGIYALNYVAVDAVKITVSAGAVSTTTSTTTTTLIPEFPNIALVFLLPALLAAAALAFRMRRRKDLPETGFA